MSATLLKRDSDTRVFLWILRMFSVTSFVEYPSGWLLSCEFFLFHVFNNWEEYGNSVPSTEAVVPSASENIVKFPLLDTIRVEVSFQ